MELKGVLWTYYMWPQEAEWSPHFVDIGCSLRELHSLEAWILSCVAGRECFYPACTSWPWEIQTKRPLYSRPQKTELIWLPIQCPPFWLDILLQPLSENEPIPTTQRRRRKNKTKQNWVSKSSRGEIKSCVLLRIEFDSREHKVELFPDRHESMRRWRSLEKWLVL